MIYESSIAIPLAIYVHIPWCVRKCPYCDFNSHAAPTVIPEQSYVDALVADLEQDRPKVEGRCVTSVFIGGGTPSLVSPGTIQYLLRELHVRLEIRPDVEVTLEANPGTVEQGKFRDFRAAGINRLSIGVQSFNDGHLSHLGRIHDCGEAIRAVEIAQAAGFDNINLDLMFGLPEQSPAQAQADIATAVALGPSHISHYQLTLEPNTLFHRYPPSLPDDDLLWEMQEGCQARLLNSGYTHYEVSAYARAGWRCRHNLNYWQFGDYLGIGAGAHSKLTDAVNGRISRFCKLKNPRDYRRHAGSPRCRSGERVIAPQELGLEFMMNALRLTEGFSTALFSERTGLPIEQLQPVLMEARDRRLLQWQGEQIRPTPLGRRFLNDLLVMFMPEESAYA